MKKIWEYVLREKIQIKRSFVVFALCSVALLCQGYVKVVFFASPMSATFDDVMFLKINNLIITPYYEVYVGIIGSMGYETI